MIWQHCALFSRAASRRTRDSRIVAARPGGHLLPNDQRALNESASLNYPTPKRHARIRFPLPPADTAEALPYSNPVAARGRTDQREMGGSRKDWVAAAMPTATRADRTEPPSMRFLPESKVAKMPIVAILRMKSAGDRAGRLHSVNRRDQAQKA